MEIDELKKKIRTIPHFPKQGVMFRDITTLLKDPEAVKDVVSRFVLYFKNKNIDVVVAPEARGFIFGSLVAYELNASFVPIRKSGKLPAKTIKYEYELEYGKDCIEIHEDAIENGQKVLIIDDLLATGGTIEATIKLVENLGAIVVGLGFLIELVDLYGRKRLKNYDVFSILQFKEDDP